MSDREPILVIADIIQKELDLGSEQVMIYNQRFKIPTDPGLYVVLSVPSGDRIIASNNYSVQATDGMNEVQEASISSPIQIDVMSFNDEARLRRFETVLALNSIYAQQQCEQHGIHIAPIPSNMKDVSVVEGGALLNRYTMTVTTNWMQSKTKAILGYYDTFQTPEVLINE